MIIEDNKDVTTYIQSIVDDQYQVETALNGKIGLERAIELIPDIIISDVMMPEMDGYSLTQALKNDERTSHIPIILLTAKAAEKDRMTGLQTGADAYLTKPFNKTELMIRLEKLTQLRKALQAHYASDNALSSITGRPSNLEDAFLKKIHLLVEAHLEDSNFGIEELCQELELSRMQVHRKLKALTDRSTSHFIRSIRLHKAKELLLTTKLTVSEIAYDTGFSDPNHFSRVFKENFGMGPTQVRK